MYFWIYFHKRGAILLQNQDLVSILQIDILENVLSKNWILWILDGHPSLRSGLWILCGVLIFTIIEKIFSGYANANKSNNPTKSDENGNGLSEKKGSQPIKISGYLNLIANSIDNFTNGLAVAGSFLVSFHHGFLGLLAILCEIRNYSICYYRTLIIMMFVCLFFFAFSAWDTSRSRWFCDSFTVRI